MTDGPFDGLLLQRKAGQLPAIIVFVDFVGAIWLLVAPDFTRLQAPVSAAITSASGQDIRVSSAARAVVIMFFELVPRISRVAPIFALSPDLVTPCESRVPVGPAHDFTGIDIDKKPPTAGINKQLQFVAITVPPEQALCLRGVNGNNRQRQCHCHRQGWKQNQWSNEPLEPAANRLLGVGLDRCCGG